MMNKIKKISEVLALAFVVIAVFIVIVTVWGSVSTEVAKDLFVKVGYTFGTIFIGSLVVLFLIGRK